MKPTDLATRRSAFARVARLAALGFGARALAAPSPGEPSADARASARSGVVDLLDFIPLQLRSSVAEGRSPPDVSRYMRAALAALGEPGGLLRVAGGTFRLTETIVLPRRVRIVGTGRETSIFQIAHDGDGFRSEAPLNAFTPVNVGIEHVGLVCLDNRASRGAGFRDRGGTYVDLHSIRIFGFRYGCLLDQSEIVSIDLCQLEYAREAAIWLVNGHDQSSGALTTYTNRIAISRCQVNQADGFGVIDDGGRAHSFRDNNFNGCRLGQLRLAGFGEYIVDGNYFEGSAGAPILISNQTVHGRNVQRPNSVVITGNLIIAEPGKPSITFEGATAATMTGNTLVGEGVPSIAGLNTVESLTSDGNAVRNPAGLFENSRAVRRQRSGELTIDRFERVRLPALSAGARRTLRLEMADARPGDMPLVSFEPPLALRAFMPFAEAGAVVIELENASQMPTVALDALVRIRLLKA